MKDISGQRFGRLVALKWIGVNKNSSSIWLCICDCGNEKEVIKDALKTGSTKSCGCLDIETKHLNRLKHGESHKSRLYEIWSGMRNRCNCKNRKTYKYYGGQGVTTAPEWDDFIVFKEWALKNGYSDTLTIDRIESIGNYEPSNCRWITIQEQQKNRRKKGTCV